MTIRGGLSVTCRTGNRGCNYPEAIVTLLIHVCVLFQLMLGWDFNGIPRRHAGDQTTGIGDGGLKIGSYD
jgi:hypothetical protein